MDVAAPRPLSLGGSRDWSALARDGALRVFFVALACSISLTQILLAALFVLAVPWAGRPARPARPGGLLAALGAARGARAAWHPLTPPLLAFVAWTLVSAAFSGNPGWSFWIARDVLRVATFYLVLAYTRDGRHAVRLWQGFLVALTLMAAYGLVQAYLCGARPQVVPAEWLGEICIHPERVSGPFSIYMTFGGVLLLGALFLLACLTNVPWRLTWWMLPAGAVTIAALAFTYSRNAWLGLAAGTAGLVVIGRRTGRLLVVLAVLAAGAVTAMPGAVAERARSIVDLEDPTVRDRVAMWRAGLAMIADRPLVGMGPGEVRAWYQHYRRPEAVRPSTGHLHNSAVQIAAERGLPALAAWVWLWVVFFREGWRVLRRVGREPSTARGLVSASLGGVAGFLVAGLFEHNFGDGEVVMVVYALMALPWIVDRELDRTPAAAAAPGPRHGVALTGSAPGVGA
jgi:putative inorganic carbon (HCO3(-)) transporter